jgi:hypothetical protein
MVGLAAALAVAPTSLLAEAQVQGTPEAVRIDTQNSSIEEVLTALGNAFELRYRSSANLAKQLSGTYEGSLQRVVARVLEGYDFVLRNNKGKIEITVLGTRGAAPAAAVASSTSNPPKTAPIPQTTPAAAAPPRKATEQPAPVTPPGAPDSKSIKVAEGQIPGLQPAGSPSDLSKVTGMNVLAAPTEGQTPGLVPATETTDLSKIPGMNIVSAPSDGQIPGLVPATSPTDLSKIPGMSVVSTPAEGQIPGLTPAESPSDLSKIPGMNIVASPMPATGLTPNSAQGQGETGQSSAPIPMPGNDAAASPPGLPMPARQ